MESSDLSRDASGTRAFSQFLVELADKIPNLVLPNISLLMAHLEGDVSQLTLDRGNPAGTRRQNYVVTTSFQRPGKVIISP